VSRQSHSESRYGWCCVDQPIPGGCLHVALCMSETPAVAENSNYAAAPAALLEPSSGRVSRSSLPGPTRLSCLWHTGRGVSPDCGWPTVESGLAVRPVFSGDAWHSSCPWLGRFAVPCDGAVGHVQRLLLCSYGHPSPWRDWQSPGRHPESAWVLSVSHQ